MWGCVFVCPIDVLCDALTASTSLSARAPCCTPSRVTRRKRALEPSRWQRRGPRRKRRSLFRYSFAGGSLPDPIKSMLLPSEDFSPDFGKVVWRPRGCCAGGGTVDRVVPAPAGRTTRPWRTCTLGRAASMAHATTICHPEAERSAARATLGEVRSAPSFVTLPRCGTMRHGARSASRSENHQLCKLRHIIGPTSGGRTRHAGSASGTSLRPPFAVAVGAA